MVKKKMQVMTKDDNQVYEVFDISYDRHDYPKFLIYDGRAWVNRSAKYFRPAIMAGQNDAELERVKRERDAAVFDLKGIMRAGSLSSIDTCLYCANQKCSKRGGYEMCDPQWRGVKEGQVV